MFTSFIKFSNIINILHLFNSCLFEPSRVALSNHLSPPIWGLPPIPIKRQSIAIKRQLPLSHIGTFDGHHRWFEGPTCCTPPITTSTNRRGPCKCHGSHLLSSSSREVDTLWGWPQRAIDWPTHRLLYARYYSRRTVTDWSCIAVNARFPRPVVPIGTQRIQQATFWSDPLD